MNFEKCGSNPSRTLLDAGGCKRCMNSTEQVVGAGKADIFRQKGAS